MKDSPVWASLSALLRADRPLKALVVEDEASLRERLTLALEALGHAVDAREGVERSELPLGEYDVAFLDNYFLSKTLTGVSLTPELRRASPGTRIIGMSSDAGKNAEMVRMGADVAIAKSAMRRLV